MYKKRYTGFWLWMLGFLAAMLGICFLPLENEAQMMRLVLLLMVWGVAGMTLIIWRTESVYWYNGTSFEEAEAAGSERRKEFAWKHLRIFGGYAMGLTLFVALMLWLNASVWIDFTIGTLGLVAAALMTIPIKL